MNKTTTNRGFELYEFTDYYGSKCSLQKSSVATEDCIWLGIDDPEPEILASKVMKNGTGWIKYPIPEDVQIRTRMHLSREEAKQLLPILQSFVETGEI